MQKQVCAGEQTCFFDKIEIVVPLNGNFQVPLFDVNRQSKNIANP